MRDDLIALSGLAEVVAAEYIATVAFPYGTQLYLSRALSRVAATLTKLIDEFEQEDSPF